MSGSVESVPATFDALRPRLVGVAYGLLGSVTEAEDVVQDAWIRLQRTDYEEIDDLTGWLVTTTSRLALDVLRSARHRREAYVGPWLPEPVETAPDPADSVTLAESVSWAMMVVLETLSPAERTAFVLHDLFGLSFDEIATALGRSPAGCRKLASRARAHIDSRTPRFDVDPTTHHEVVEAFADAATTGDLEGLLQILDPSAVLTADGGGIVRAALRPIVGADAIARFLAGLAGQGGPAKRMRAAVVNHNPALLVFVGDELDGIVALGIAGGRVTAIDFVRNPEKLTRIGRREP
ncbi:RNA polymerase sigma factor SigJ [Gordonia sp. NB41Y]|uniref:RNA polymerase sigma factor SigJ n=1 Tax=Gordonia sp. NB41Y TaxID=875808 RepID=UPI0006B2268A|nr:RNA polymerase sigma factor SigJ [Gordonia sp. NB41Y]EMP14247.2 siderophore-interacting protein [Gordonia sp. NB41Y]WLP89920.1 RNA polymerase sigma factor SigJ [Gordonia sp. NB41Y]